MRLRSDAKYVASRIADAATEEKPVVATTDVQFDVRLVVDEIKAVLNADDDGGIATLSIRGFKTNAKVSERGRGTRRSADSASSYD